MKLSLNMGFIKGAGAGSRPAARDQIVQWLVRDGYSVADRFNVVSAPTIADYITFPPPYLGDTPDPDATPDPYHVPTIFGTITQTDAYLLDSLFWSANGSTFDAKSYSHLAAHVSGNYNLWIKWSNEYECTIEEIVQYDLDWAPTPSEAYRNFSYFKQFGCGGGVLEIEYDQDGTPEINQDGSVELVQPT